MSDHEATEKEVGTAALTPKTEPDLAEAGTGEDVYADAMPPSEAGSDDHVSIDMDEIDRSESDLEGAVATAEHGEPRAAQPVEASPLTLRKETLPVSTRTRAHCPALSEAELHERFQNFGTLSRQRRTDKPRG